MIPVMLHLDRKLFEALEHIAEAKKTTVRDLITGHLRAGLDPERHSRVITSRGRPVNSEVVSQWVAAAQMGVTNEVIAERWGVSRQIVSRCLIERGIRRQKPKG